MRGLRKVAPAVIGVSVLALTLSACGGSSDSGSGGGDSASYVTVNGSEPQNPLIPAATNETGGGNVIDAMFTGLVTYNQETAAPENAVATSIESSDQQNWKIKIRDDWKFQDGTPVTARELRGCLELGSLWSERRIELLLLRAHRGLR